MTKKYVGFHFSNLAGTLANGDGRKIVLGETLSVEGSPELCSFGLHWSEQVRQALKYGNARLWLVEGWGDVQRGDDKYCGTHRKAIKDYGNILPLIVEYAFWCSERAAEYAAKYAEYAAAERKAQEQWWHDRLSQLTGHGND